MPPWPEPASALAARWRAWPPWARYATLHAATLGLALALGLATPLGAGNALFLAGAGWILASLTQIRTGGHRKKVTYRDLEGKVIGRETVVSPEREAQIRRGAWMFLVGLGLWAPLFVVQAL